MDSKRHTPGKVRQSTAAKPIPEVLLGAARDHARYALEAHSEDGSSEALTALAAGTAVEAIIKGALGRLLPSLLADKGDPHTQLFFSGKGSLPGKTYLDCRTVSALEARSILATARPTIQLTKDEVQKVLSIRNAAAHMATVRSTELAEAMRSMVVCIEAFLPELGQNSKDFWGTGLHAHATSLRQESNDAVAIGVERCKTAARVRLERLKALSQEAFEAIAETLDADGRHVEDEGDDYGGPEKCPVCGFHGWISGPIERGPLETDPMGDNVPTYWVIRQAIIQEFYCGVCGLHLIGREIALAGMPTVIDLEPDDDPYEATEIWEEMAAEAAYERSRDERLY